MSDCIWRFNSKQRLYWSRPFGSVWLVSLCCCSRTCQLQNKEINKTQWIDWTRAAKKLTVRWGGHRWKSPNGVWESFWGCEGKWLLVCRRVVREEVIWIWANYTLHELSIGGGIEGYEMDRWGGCGGIVIERERELAAWLGGAWAWWEKRLPELTLNAWSVVAVRPSNPPSLRVPPHRCHTEEKGWQWRTGGWAQREREREFRMKQ